MKKQLLYFTLIAVILVACENNNPVDYGINYSVCDRNFGSNNTLLCKSVFHSLKD